MQLQTLKIMDAGFETLQYTLNSKQIVKMGVFVITVILIIKFQRMQMDIQSYLEMLIVMILK